MSMDYVIFLLLISMFVAVGVLTYLCVRYYLRLRNVGWRLELAETRLGEYRRRLSLMRGRLAGDKRISDAVASGLQPRGAEPDAGEGRKSELRLRLQRGHQRRSSGIVERYRLVGNMVRRGLSADDISAILQLPRGETEQLLKLSQVSRG